MSHFTELTRNLGDVAENLTIDIYYPLAAGSPAVSRVDVECSQCMSSYILPDSVMIRFKTLTIAPQRIKKGFMTENIDRGATVVFSDGSSERISFTGDIVRQSV